MQQQPQQLPVAIEPPSHPALRDARSVKTPTGEPYLALHLHDDGILVVTLTRGKTHAFDDQTYLCLTDALLSAETNPQVLVVVLTGSNNYFTSGADLESSNENSLKLHKGLINEPTGIFMRVMARFSKPLIAAISGPAIGIGATLLPHCDVCYASDKTYFWTPFSRIALLPEFASSYTFPRILGVSVANEMILFGKKLSAQRAKELGLVSDVFPAGDDFLSKCLDQVRQGLIYPMLDKSLPLFKHTMKRWDAGTIETVIAAELQVLDGRVQRREPARAIAEFQLQQAKKKKSQL